LGLLIIGFGAEVGLFGSFLVLGNETMHL